MSRHSFLGRSVRSFTRALSKALFAEESARRPGLLQALDPRVRVIGLLSLVIAVVACRRIEVIAGLLLLAVALAALSRISLVLLAQRLWTVVLGFTGIIALPALFLTPGRPLLVLPGFGPAISEQGLRTVVLLILRVETAATYTTLLMLCTPWMQTLKALRSLGMPGEMIAVMAMTHRYIFLLLETVGQMFDARQSRIVGALPRAEQRRMIARTAGVLMSKSSELGQEAYLAMMSRGFRGDLRLLKEFRMRTRDYAALISLVLAAATAAWIGR
jgi:cobalt ECF transporter T component CbiQ